MKLKSKNVSAVLGVLIIIAVLGCVGCKNRDHSGKAQTAFKLDMKKQHVDDNGVEKMIQRVREVAGLPEKLYIQNDITVMYDHWGVITAVEATLCGKDKEDKLNKYVLSYHQNESDNMKITVEKVEKAVVTEDKLLDPLFTTLSKIDVEDIVTSRGEEDVEKERYGILYRGYRSFEDDPTGIIYVDKEGKTKEVHIPRNEFAGNFVSVYIPNKEKEYPPHRYLLVEDLKEIPKAATNKKAKRNDKKKQYLTDEVGYALTNIDKNDTGGYYALRKTTDGGENWNTCNEYPFVNFDRVVDPGLYFINEKLGFVTARSKFQTKAGLYRTEDGGTTFKEIVIKSEEKDGAFDFPEPPYEEDGMLKLKVTKGADADNTLTDFTIYGSTDQGKTWKALEKQGN